MNFTTWKVQKKKCTGSGLTVFPPPQRDIKEQDTFEVCE